MHVLMTLLFIIITFCLPKMESNTFHDLKGSLYMYPSGPNLETKVKLHEAMPALTEALPCSFSVGHSNMIGYLSVFARHLTILTMHKDLIPKQFTIDRLR